MYFCTGLKVNRCVLTQASTEHEKQQQSSHNTAVTASLLFHVKCNPNGRQALTERAPHAAEVCDLLSVFRQTEWWHRQQTVRTSRGGADYKLQMNERTRLCSTGHSRFILKEKQIDKRKLKPNKNEKLHRRVVQGHIQLLICELIFCKLLLILHCPIQVTTTDQNMWQSIDAF